MTGRAFALFAALAATGCAEPLDLTSGTQVELADAVAGAKLLGTSDAYLQRMSPFDRAAGMRLAEPPSPEVFARNAAENVREFTMAERAQMKAAVAEMRTLLEPLKLAFPKRIIIVKTNGREDIGEAYCRGPVIVLPEKYFALAEPRMLVTVLLHELFHVFSTHHPELRDRLYALLDYLPCAEVVLPPAEDARRLTNPDAMRCNYYTIINDEGRDRAVTPLLLARREKYDPTAPGSVFNQVSLLLVELEVRDGKASPVLDGQGRVVTHEARQVPAFMKRMARNTGYVIHPEEVLADNFVHVARKTAGLPVPELPVKLLGVMQSAAP